MNKNFFVSYAQNREDVLLAAFFKDVKRGFYVDVGANHPVDDSVTKYFYDNGWKGINIEPNKKLFNALERERPRDININIGVSDKPGALVMREYSGNNTGLSTFSQEAQATNKSAADFQDVKKETATLKQIFFEHGVGKVHFLKVDVEGFEYEVLKGNDWSKFRPEVLCIEANHIIKDWRELLSRVKYTKVFFDGLNEYYLAEEASNRLENFSYVESIIGQEIVSSEVMRQIDALEYKIEQQRGEINGLKSEILRQNLEIIELKKVVPLTKQLLKSLDGSARRKIEKLNKTKQKDSIRAKFTYSSVSNKEKLLLAIREYDMNTYYSREVKSDRLLYKVVFTIYDGGSKISFATGKKLLGLARRLKR